MTKFVRARRRVKGLTGRLEKTDVQRFFRYTVYIYCLLCERSYTIVCLVVIHTSIDTFLLYIYGLVVSLFHKD
jgi:hypothetical protein